MLKSTSMKIYLTSLFVFLSYFSLAQGMNVPFGSTRPIDTLHDVGAIRVDGVASLRKGLSIADTFEKRGNLLEITNDLALLTGTVSTTSGSDTVRGHSTYFRHTFRRGEYIGIGANTYKILAVFDDSTMRMRGVISVTQSRVSYNNPTKRAVFKISGAGKMSFGNAEFITSTPWFNNNHIVDPGFIGVGTANTNFLNRLTIESDTAVANGSIQIAAQNVVIIGDANRADYTSTGGFTSGITGSLNHIQTEQGATGTVTKASASKAVIDNVATGVTISNAYGYNVPSAINNGAISKLAGVAIGAQTVATDNTHLLLGTENIPTGDYAIMDSTNLPSRFSGALTLSNLAGSGSRMVVSDANGLLSTTAIPTGGVTEVTGTSPISVATGTSTPVVSMTAAASGVSGYVNTAIQRLGSGLKQFDAIQIITSTTDTGNNPIRPFQSNNTIAFTSSAYTSAYTGYTAQPIISASNTQNWTSTGNTLNNGGLGGFTFAPNFAASSTGTFTLTGGFMSSYVINGSVAFTTIRQFHAKNPSGAGAGITNLVGYHAEQQTRATNNAGFVYGTQTTGNYAFYNSTSDNNDLGTGRTIMTTPNIRSASTPSSGADASGSTGDIRWDADYIYVKTAGGWKRAALSTWP